MIFARKRPPAGHPWARRSRHRISAALLAALTFFGALSLLLLCACADTRRTLALSLLNTLVAADTDHPAGETYLTPDAASLALVSEATDDSAVIRTASPSLLRAAFGVVGGDASSIPWEISLIDDGAMRFSTANSPCEWIVLHCANRSDTDAVAEMLLRRLNTLRRLWRNTEEASVVEQGQVVILGQYVLLILCDDTEGCLRAARNALP